MLERMEPWEGTGSTRGKSEIRTVISDFECRSGVAQPPQSACTIWTSSEASSG